MICNCGAMAQFRWNERRLRGPAEAQETGDRRRPSTAFRGVSSDWLGPPSVSEARRLLRQSVRGHGRPIAPCGAIDDRNQDGKCEHCVGGELCATPPERGREK